MNYKYISVILLILLMATVTGSYYYYSTTYTTYLGKFKKVQDERDSLNMYIYKIDTINAERHENIQENTDIIANSSRHYRDSIRAISNPR